MRNLFLVLIALVACLATAQDYTPAKGETVMRLKIEGKGNIVILLFGDKAPKAVRHITGLAESKFYDGMRFHRVETSPKPFLVQVGDPNSKRPDFESIDLGTGGTGARIPFEETNEKNVEGMVGLAHLPEDKDSGDSQFYMLLGTARFLDGNYTIFGRIKSGMDILRKIQKNDVLSSVSIIKG